MTASLTIEYANPAAEPLAAFVKANAELAAVVTRVLASGTGTQLTNITLGTHSAATLVVGPMDRARALVMVLTGDAQSPMRYTEFSQLMAAMLAHEIRNPLLSIKGAAQLLQQESSDAELCELISKEVDRIEQLIATLDPLSQTPRVQLETLNIHEVLEHARVASLAAHPNVRFVLQYDPSLPEIRGDRARLIQLFLNLMKNASEALESQPDPAITLTSRFALGDARRNEQGEALPVAVSVSDNGPGIASAVREQLFAPFTTTKQGGRGLGLAVVAQIAEEHGGVITAESPSGARFTLYLPIAMVRATPA